MFLPVVAFQEQGGDGRAAKLQSANFISRLSSAALQQQPGMPKSSPAGGKQARIFRFLPCTRLETGSPQATEPALTLFPHASFTEHRVVPQATSSFSSPTTQSTSLCPACTPAAFPSSEALLLDPRAGRDKQQQRSPRGSQRLSPPGSHSPGCSTCFLPIACHRLAHHRPAAVTGGSSGIPSSAAGPATPRQPGERFSLAAHGERWASLCPAPTRRWVGALCDAAGPGLSAKRCSAACGRGSSGPGEPGSSAAHGDTHPCSPGTGNTRSVSAWRELAHLGGPSEEPRIAQSSQVSKPGFHSRNPLAGCMGSRLGRRGKTQSAGAVIYVWTG